jgi:hypothetical protein
MTSRETVHLRLGADSGGGVGCIYIALWEGLYVSVIVREELSENFT